MVFAAEIRQLRSCESDELRQGGVELLKADVQVTELGTILRQSCPTTRHQSKPNTPQSAPQAYGLQTDGQTDRQTHSTQLC